MNTYCAPGPILASIYKRFTCTTLCIRGPVLAQAEYSTSTYYVFGLHTGYGLYEHLLGASHGPGPRLFSTGYILVGLLLLPRWVI